MSQSMIQQIEGLTISKTKKYFTCGSLHCKKAFAGKNVYRLSYRF